MKRAVWGPSSPLAIALELDERQAFDRYLRSLSLHLYSRQGLSLAYRTPVYVLRRRATYGGRKGRAAIRRLKAMGCAPLVPGGDADG